MPKPESRVAREASEVWPIHLGYTFKNKEKTHARSVQAHPKTIIAGTVRQGVENVYGIS